MVAHVEEREEERERESERERERERERPRATLYSTEGKIDSVLVRQVKSHMPCHKLSKVSRLVTVTIYIKVLLSANAPS